MELKRTDGIDSSAIDEGLNQNFSMPNFIRLFEIGRIVIDNKGTSVPDFDLQAVFNVNKEKEIAEMILTNLLKCGIQGYINWYDEQSQGDIIEKIFNKIILKQFKQKYMKLISQNYNNCFQNSVFNTIDLMCSIFQFLEWNFMFHQYVYCDLSACSLVNSHWLIASWNPNSVYHIKLTELIKGTSKCNAKNNYNYKFMSKNSSKWQRVFNAKNVDIHFMVHDIINIVKDQYILSKISMMKNIQRLNFSCEKNYDSLMPLLEVIHDKCGQTIRQYDWDCRIQTSQLFAGTPVKLISAAEIRITNTYFPIIWTNECHTLKFDNLTVDSKWCNYIIDNCDCGGVKSLYIDISSNDTITHGLLNKLLSKFNNVESLDLLIAAKNFRHQMAILNWLHSNLKQDELKLGLVVTCDLKQDDYFKLCQTIDNYDIKILSLCCDIENSVGVSQRVLLNRLIQHKYLQHLGLVNHDMDAFESWRLVIDTLSMYEDSCDVVNCNTVNLNEKDGLFTSLMSIELTDCDEEKSMNLGTINLFFQLDLIAKQELFVKTDFHVKINLYDLTNDQFIQFDELWHNVSELMAKQKPIDIAVTLHRLGGMKHVFEYFASKCCDIFLSYFDNKCEAIKQYQYPKCNKYCTKVMKPITGFVMEVEELRFYVKNAFSLQN